MTTNESFIRETWNSNDNEKERNGVVDSHTVQCILIVIVTAD